MRPLALLSILLLSAAVQAGWFDDFSKNMNQKLNDATEWVTDVAAPAISEKASEVSATVQDPETHRNIKNWFVEKYDAASEFTNEKIVPELKKAYDNAAEIVVPSNNE